MLTLKAHAILTGVLFAAIVVFAMAGNVLHDQGILADSSAMQLGARVIFFSLFLAFGYSCIPLMVKIVLAGQIKVGNGEQPLVRAMVAREAHIVIVFWLLITAGLAIAIPAAIMDGFFDSDPAAIQASPK
jgi:hypothetical protein